MPLYKRTLSKFVFRRFMLKNHASNLLPDLNLEAEYQALEYIKANMIDAPYFEEHSAPMKFALDEVSRDSLHLEFGVGRGKSMRWQERGFKAFQELVARTGLKYGYIAFSVTGQQVAVRVLENPDFSG